MMLLVKAMALFRILFGLAFLFQPKRLGEAWIGARGRERPVQVLSRSIGGRDVALGAGALASAVSGDEKATIAWMAAQGASDASDLAGMWAARGALPASGARQGALAAGASLILCAGVIAALATRND